MKRVIGMDIHRTFAEVVIWEAGQLRPAGRVDMSRAGLEGFGRTLSKEEDEVVIEATGNAMAVVRALEPHVARVIVANPTQVKAIAYAQVKTDKIDAGVLASLRAANFLPEVWLPDTDTERMRRQVARRNQVVRHRTRIKNEVHAILHAHLVPCCPHDLFARVGRDWLGRQTLPDDERAAVARHLRELDRLGEDLDVLDRDIAQAAINDPVVKRLLTITGVNLIVAAGRSRRSATCAGSPAPRSSSATSASTRGCGSPAWVSRSMAVSANSGVHMRAPCWSRRHGRQPRPQGRCVRSSCASERGAVIRWQPSQSRASWPCCAGTC